MKEIDLANYTYFFWDFDGVIKESVSIKTNAFKKLFSDQNNSTLLKIIDHHLENGGVSRYEKIPLYNELTKDGTVCNKIHSSISDLLVLRKKQKAFHPNAVQFTLHLGKDLYGIWRQSLDKRQSIFCISNITNKNKEFSLIDINLIGFDSWFDLISGDVIEDLSSSLKLKPYQTVWITNTQVVE